jgi:RND family efflux transporter MFP subunit
MKVLISVCMLAASSALLAGCHSTESNSPAAVQTASARVVESRQEETPMMVRATGTLHARESATISAQVVGRIEQVLVHEGDSVKAGQTLVVLDDATLRAAADQAQAAVKAAESQQTAAQTNAALATSTLNRYKQLQAEKSVSPQEMDEVAQRAEAAAAEVSALRAQGDAVKAQESGARSMLGYTRLLAPFAGVVTARMADPGTMAAPGVPLLQVESAGPLQLQAAVDESAIANVRKGMKVPVAIDGVHDGEIGGTVAEIVPAADPASHSFMVKIDLPASSRYHAGMYGNAEFATGKHQAIIVPRSAVVVRGSLACVYVLDSNGMAQLRSITLGTAHGDFVEVLSGLSFGEKLVDLPGDRDLAGKRIEAQP